MSDTLTVRVPPGRDPHYQPSRFLLRCYFPHEIEKLSVLHVNQVKTFDEVGHPIKGGLYDPRLGPNDVFDQCDTCHQNGEHCPGHMGHIELEVPVFNPLLFNFTLAIMKGSCVQCHRFTCKTEDIHGRLLLAQLRAIDLGLASVAEELSSLVKGHSEKSAGIEVAGDGFALSDEMNALHQLDALFTELTGNSVENMQKEILRPYKNTVELKHRLVKAYCREHLFYRRRRCPLCKRSNGILRNDHNRCILIDFTASDNSKLVKSAKAKKPLVDLYGYDAEDIVNEDVDVEKKKLAEMDESLSKNSLANMSAQSLYEQMVSVFNGSCDKLAWRGSEVREHFRLLWKAEGTFLKKLFPIFDCEEEEHCPMDVLFCDVVLVPPTKFRPIRMFKGEKFENPQTVNLRRVLEATETVKAIKLALAGSTDSPLLELIDSRIPGKTMQAKMHNSYLALQQHVNGIFDQDLNKMTNNNVTVPGIKQILEKKEGLFRMNMMGKRVNFACRSVITPDPYLDIDEIGIPEEFAKKLTFREPVNVLNVAILRELVKRGPFNYPGAMFIQKSGGPKQILRANKDSERYAIAKRLQPADPDRLPSPAQVYRHMRNGDLVLMNRQPSLHKPSIMGHRVRVLRGQRALRMNYAPCKAYNADFDGDEMNGHFVQNRVAQTEAAEIVNVGSNYLVPKDGTPLLGLIQDHVVSGVLLTMRGRFFNKEDFMYLLLAAFSETTQKLVIPRPSMLKPERLWSGKQIISAVLINSIPRGKPLINLSSKAKTPLSCWKVSGRSAPSFSMSESEVIFRQAELLCGVLDKQHYGSTQYGLIHCCWELYGHRCATRILSCLSRLFTTYLQLHGFSLGVIDILVKKSADKERSKVIQELRQCGDLVVKTCFGLGEDATQAEIKHAVATAYCNPRHDDYNIQQLEYKMKETLSEFSDRINKTCVPNGLIREFPSNALQMMILCGSKGTMVNSVQISCGLGQIELEGHRPPMTIVGRTLPSFHWFDTSPRASGFVDQRFLTGLSPQELFFHTMAGREGLIDTAVKTSRSGYLQRCIVKHLEGLVLAYDSTVRDHDNSVVQFRYGEDGMDVCRSSFMVPGQMDFLSNNMDAVKASALPTDARESEWNPMKSRKAYKKVMRWRKKGGNVGRKRYVGGFLELSKDQTGKSKEDLTKTWYEMSIEERKHYNKKAGKKYQEAVNMKLDPTQNLGALPEKMLDNIHDYINRNENWDHHQSADSFERLLYWKGMRSLVDAGENVGLLAAQSIGEPSTQMTLNTFHFAGRGEMNVTLGIPRLREILMTASTNIKTPSAEVLSKPGVSEGRIEKIKREFDRVYLNQVIRKFSVDERINLLKGDCWRRYVVSIELLRAKLRDPSAQHISRRMALQAIETRFLKSIAKRITERLKELSNFQTMMHKRIRQGDVATDINEDNGRTDGSKRIDEGGSSDEEVEGGKDADASEARLKIRHRDDAADYEGEQEEKEDIAAEDLMKEEFAEVLEDSEVELDSSEKLELVGSKLKTIKEGGCAEQARIQAVLLSSPLIKNYKYDTNHNRWCIATFQLPLNTRTRLDMTSLIEHELEHFIVSETPGVERCVVNEKLTDEGKKYILQTQGINLEALVRHSDVLDVNTLYSNDLNLIMCHYGIEACARALVKEIIRVFTPYGIDVNRRHLTLTADYMTFTGAVLPFSRGAMSSSASPLQRMTFETTVGFMREALVHGESDFLSSPSARLVVGGLLNSGTSIFDLLVPNSYSLGRSWNGGNSLVS